MRRPPEATDAREQPPRGPGGGFPQLPPRPRRARGRPSRRKSALPPPAPGPAPPPEPTRVGRAPGEREASAGKRPPSRSPARPYLSRRGSGGELRRAAGGAPSLGAATAAALPGKGAAESQGCIWAAPARAARGPRLRGRHRRRHRRAGASRGWGAETPFEPERKGIGRERRDGRSGGRGGAVLGLPARPGLRFQKPVASAYPRHPAGNKVAGL